MVESANIVDPVVLIRVPRAFRPGMSNVALYEATRGVWTIGPRRAEARYALAIYQGEVQEVYEIVEWQPALTTPYTTRKLDKAKAVGRWEFVGKIARSAVRERYLGKSVAHYFKRGAQNPVMYAGLPSAPPRVRR
jgi:hypothetical protein